MNENITNTVLKQALYYLENLGWSIIPVGRNKKPIIEWKFYQTNKPTREQVIEWWKKYPDSNVAIITGKVSNLIVVDIDPRHGGSLDEFKQIIAPRVKTGGNGWHIYFQYEEGFRNGAGVKKGVDIRAEGGYAIAPPSLHQLGKHYEWEVFPDE